MSKQLSDPSRKRGFNAAKKGSGQVGFQPAVPKKANPTPSPSLSAFPSSLLPPSTSTPISSSFTNSQETTYETFQTLIRRGTLMSQDAPPTGTTAHVEYLDILLQKLDEEKARIYQISDDDMCKLPWGEFIRSMRLLSAQSWGSKVEKYLIKYYNWEKVSPQENKGDARTKNDHYYEIKATIITNTNRQANFVQIRPYQDINGYQLFVVHEDYTVTRFVLSKEDMITELELLNSGNAHGTRATNDENKHKEYAVRLEIGSPHWQRWVQKYKSKAATPDKKHRTS